MKLLPKRINFENDKKLEKINHKNLILGCLRIDFDYFIIYVECVYADVIFIA